MFIETSGNGCLRPRQACAVESAALTNPDMQIVLYMALGRPTGTPERDSGEGLERRCETMAVLERMPNVQILRQDLSAHLKGTPLQSLLEDGLLGDSQYSYQHWSDALRIALLFKHGGIYLDLDVVVLRSMRCLRNAAGHVTIAGETSVENDVLIFDRGHKLLSFFMRYMDKMYRPDHRSVIGPIGLTAAFRMFCNWFHNLNDFTESFTCHAQYPFTMMYPKAFHPIGYFERDRFFSNEFSASELDNLRMSYSVHVYGSGHGATVPASSLFALLADRFCPHIYGLSKSNVYTF